MTQPLTSRQLGLLQYLREADPFPPTIRELVRALEFNSTSTVAYNLTVLQDAGHIKLHRGVARGIEVLDNDSLTIKYRPDDAQLVRDAFPDPADFKQATLQLCRERLCQ